MIIKKLLFILATICTSSLMMAQTTTENYIKNTTYQVKTTTGNVSNSNKLENVTYFDGLGRPMQSVGIRAGGNNEDIITYIGYDNFGKQDKDYLPYAAFTNNGLYRTNGLTDTNTFYDAAKYEVDFSGVALNDINAYSQKDLEASPLNRVLKQAAPGKDWKQGNGHEIEFEYQTNTFDSSNPTSANNDNVKLYSVSLSRSNNTYTPTLILNSGTAGYYGEKRTL